MRGTLQEHVRTFMTKYRWILFKMRNISDTPCTENQNTQFILIPPPPQKNRAVYETM